MMLNTCSKIMAVFIPPVYKGHVFISSWWRCDRWTTQAPLCWRGGMSRPSAPWRGAACNVFIMYVCWTASSHRKHPKHVLVCIDDPQWINIRVIWKPTRRGTKRRCLTSREIRCLTWRDEDVLVYQDNQPVSCLYCSTIILQWFVSYHKLVSDH